MTGGGRNRVKTVDCPQESNLSKFNVFAGGTGFNSFFNLNINIIANKNLGSAILICDTREWHEKLPTCLKVVHM